MNGEKHISGITWAEWKRWTDSDVEDFELGISDCMNHAKVHQFVNVFKDWLTYQRVQETARLMDDPKRNQRTYGEALRDITQKLTEIIETSTRSNHGLRSSSGGARR